ncbi:MAG: glucose-1-phosphate thymidylyltransferase RfbA [Patescibacteria group bacterium]
MKGIILAGGYGTRLYPVTLPVVKQLLPIYDKPMIYYPLCTLMLAGVRDILIISTPNDLPKFKELFGDGSKLGLTFSYVVQEKPGGLAEAFILGEDFIKDDSVWFILGDNIFFGSGMEEMLTEVSERRQGATVFAYRVQDPQRYGIIEFDEKENPKSIVEKPSNPKSNYAQVGLYYFDKSVSQIAKNQKYSKRGELEIVDVVNHYLKRGKLKVEIMGRGFAWLDAGTFDSLYNSSTFVKVIQERQGVIVSSPEEIAYKKGYISKTELLKIAKSLSKSNYGQYLMGLVKE